MRKERTDFSDVWVCEWCGTAHEGVNPPDLCSHCEGAYFDNMQDMINAGVQVTDGPAVVA
jgi:rubrerythrin